MTRARVLILRTAPNTVVSDLSAQVSMLLKASGSKNHTHWQMVPDVMWHLPVPAVNPPPWLLEGVAEGLLSEGAVQLGVFFAVPAVGPKHRTQDQLHYNRVINRLHLEVRNAGSSADTRWIPPLPRTGATPSSALQSRLRIPEALQNCSLALLSTVRTHAAQRTAGALHALAMLAMPPSLRRTQLFLTDADFVEACSVGSQVGRQRIYCVDGTTCGGGAGPFCLTPVQKDLLLASTDPVALDSVLARLQGFDPLEMPHLRLAQARDLGLADPDLIDVEGLDISDLRLQLPPATDVLRPAFHALSAPRDEQLPELIRFSLDGLAAGAFSKMLESVWFPLVGKRVFQRWLDTPWGRRFLSAGGIGAGDNAMQPSGESR